MKSFVDVDEPLSIAIEQAWCVKFIFPTKNNMIGQSTILFLIDMPFKWLERLQIHEKILINYTCLTINKNTLTPVFGHQTRSIFQKSYYSRDLWKYCPAI